MFENVLKDQASHYGLDPKQLSASRFVMFYADWKQKPGEVPEEVPGEATLKEELRKDLKNFQQSYWSLSGAIWDLVAELSTEHFLKANVIFVENFPF